MKRAILGAFVCALVLKLFFFDFILAEGRSMSPAIETGRLLLVNKISYGFQLPFGLGYLARWAEPAAGDVVVFWTPYGNLAVKRCAGGGGGTFVAVGDNHDHSFDSRAYGPVSTDCIVGKVAGVK
jgi:signal peptidase I